jgi:hypothetical protein
MAIFGIGGKKDVKGAQPDVSYETVPLFTTRKVDIAGGDSTLAISSVNSWEGQRYGLGSAALEIGIDKDFKPTRDEVYSIPDVFAEVRAMNAALEDPNNALHESAVADWRAAITMLLLHKELNIPIEVLEIDFNELSDGDAMFLHTAAEYLPREYEGKLSIYLTKTDTGANVPFALSSPEYFVCPAKEIRARLLVRADIAEYDGLRTILKDPSKFLHDNPAYGIRINDVFSEADGKRRVRKARALITDFRGAVGISKYNDAKLASGKMLIEDFADFDSAQTTEMTDEDIFADDVCLFLPVEEYPDKTGDKQLTYEEVFQDAMGNHRVLGDNGKTIFYALLPFSEEFLLKHAYAPNGQPDAAVFTGVSMKYKSEGSYKYIEVSLLHNETVYSRQYEESKWIEPSPRKRTFPPISVWPNSVDQANRWSAYYTFIGLQFDEDAEAHDWSAIRFDALINKGADGRKTVEKAEGEEFTEEHNVASKKYVDCKYEIIQTETYPHILLGKTANDGKYLGAIAMTSGGTGINTVSGRTAIIGIDFGTSNTVAFYSLYNGTELEEAKPIDFKNANVQPTVTNYVFDRMSSRFFLSREELTGDISFPTILHVADRKDTGIDKLFSGANIYFRGNDARGGNNVEIMKIPNLETDIKWSTDAEKRIYTKKFVTQLAVFCAWQAVSKTQASKLEWRFSFPSSISNAEDFTNALQSAAVTAARTIFGNDNNTDRPKIDLTSESHAAGLYFMNQKVPIVNRDKGFISIDIGGGSTDISIWQNDLARAKAEASIKFAGRDILTNNATSLCELGDLPKLWGQMGIKQEVINSVIGSFSDTDINLSILFDTMLSVASRGLDSALGTFGGQRPLRDVIKLVTFDMSMLVALAGSMLRDLVTNDFFELSDEIKIVFCGNGSKARNWLQAGDNKIMERVLRDVVGKTLRDVRIVFEQSKNPKQEVAAGLVSVVKLRDNYETFDAEKFGDDVLAQKIIIDSNNERYPEIANEVVYLFDCLYDILCSTDLNFGLDKYPSFREKDSFLEKMRSAVAALDPIGTGYSRITYAYAFVKCATVANNMLIKDMKDQ